MRERSPSPIEVASDSGGALVYLVRVAPGALPPVRSGDLGESWDDARQAAADAVWGEARFFRFRPPDGDPLDLALTDHDAACWSEAVDRRWGLGTPYGLSLCLRLLGLVALLAHSPALRVFCPLPRAGARIDPALLRAAASVPLSGQGQLDERHIFLHLGRAGSSFGLASIAHSGATR